MTISSNVRRAGPFTGAGSTGPYAFAFKVFTSADLYVVKMLVSTGVETELTLTTDYTVSLNADQNSNPGGTITLVSALAVGYTLTITSELGNLQPTDLTNQGGFYPSVITDSLDRSVIQTQQLQDQVNRSLKYPVSDSSSLSSELPAAAQRASTVMAFDSAGEPVAGPAVASVGTVLANIANINTVAGISANVTTVAGIDTDVTTVAGINGDVSTVSAIAVPVVTVASIGTSVGDVAAIAGDVSTVSALAADVVAVSTIAADVSTVSANVTDVTNFADVYQGAKAADPTLRNDGSALHAGDLYFNTVTDYMRVYSGTAWVEVVAGSVYAQTFSGTGAQTNFTLPIAPNSENNTQVYVSGVYQQKGTYSISGTTLIFSSAPPSGTNNIEVMIVDSLPLGTVAWSGVTGKPLVDEIVVVGATTAASTLGYDSITMVHGGGFSVASGATFTIDVPFSGGVERWFYGDGSVSFTEPVDVYPQWFGDTGSSSSYTDHLVIQKAIAAAGEKGVIRYAGFYYCGAGITSGTMQKHIGRFAPVPWSTVGAATLYFEAGITDGCFNCVGETHISHLNLYCPTTALAGIVVDGSSTATWIQADHVNVAGAVIAVYLKQTWQSSLSNCMFRYTAVGGYGVYADYCYNLHMYNTTIQFTTIGVYACNATHVTLVSCCIEEMYDSVDSVAIKTQTSRTTVNMYGCYLEPRHTNKCILMANDTTVHVEGSHVYLPGTFADMDGKTNVIFSSYNNRFALPETTDATVRYVYKLPTSGNVSIAGDLMYPTNPNVHYLSSYTAHQGFNITPPYNHYNPQSPCMYLGYPLRVVSEIAGQVTLDNATYTIVTGKLPTYASQILLTPANAAAATLQSSASAVYVAEIYEILSLEEAATPADFSPTDTITSGTSTAVIYAKNSSTNYTIKDRTGAFVKGVDITSGGNTASSTTSDYPLIYGYGFVLRTADGGTAAGTEKFNFLVIN